MGSIGPYRLLQKIGEGGMGSVYQAEQSEPIKRTVALKVIKLGMDTAHVVARFESERQALAMMNHPGIAKVFDGGATEDGRPFFVMEYVPGAPLTEYCDGNRVTVRDRLRLFTGICHAVQHAHQKGIIHRDLKPSNILVTMQDGQPVSKIIDFGIAKATSQKLTDRTLYTEIGTFVGTPIYMSPEQFENSGLDIDTRADVYSLGVVLYELLSGTTPLDVEALRAAGLAEVRRQILEADFPRPSTRITRSAERTAAIARSRGVDAQTLVRKVRGDLDWIVLKALEKDRTRRYASASELAADIERHLRDEPVLAGSPSRVYKVKKFVRRHRVGVIAATLTIVAMIFGIAGTTTGLVRAKRAEAQARDAENNARTEAATAQRVSGFLVGLFEVSDPSTTRGNSITAREILDKGAGQIRSGLKDDPTVQARLMETMGLVYRKLGLYPESRQLLESSVSTLERTAGADDPRTIAAQSALSGVLVLSGDADAARRLLTDLIPRVERVFGTDSLEVARCVNSMGGLELQSKRWAEAIPFLDRALKIREQKLGPDDLEVAKVLSNLGNAKRQLKDFDGAMKDLERAIAIRTKRLGEGDPETVKPLFNLGLVLKDKGDAGQAKAIFEKVYAVRLKTLGPAHPETIAVRAEMGP